MYKPVLLFPTKPVYANLFMRPDGNVTFLGLQCFQILKGEIDKFNATIIKMMEDSGIDFNEPPEGIELDEINYKITTAFNDVVSELLPTGRACVFKRHPPQLAPYFNNGDVYQVAEDHHNNVWVVFSKYGYINTVNKDVVH